MSIEVINFGCRLNSYEGEVIKQKAEEAGLAQAIIFNSCAVTSEAERQVRQAVRRARKEHPNAKIIVTGCSAQINPQQYAEMTEVDQVLGNQEKLNAKYYSSSPELPLGNSKAIQKTAVDSPGIPLMGDSGKNAYGEEKILVNDIMSVKETASHMVTSFEGHARAFVQVQNGCDHRCTFCIIPFGRGNSRSVPMGEIVAQVKQLVASGYNEVVLTGVDISDYGKDLPGAPTLGQMMRRLLALVPDLPRLRLSSIDAVEVDEDLYRLIEQESRLMPHIHISLQAGDDMVLKRMKRRHSRAQAMEFCQRVRKLRPDVVFGADIIAGFPTETEEMFQSTLNFVEEAGLTYLHVFPYSSRPGTPAARMPQVPKAIRKERAARLRAAGEKRMAAYYASLVGKTVEIIVENNRSSGRTQHFAEVKLDIECDTGSLIKVQIKKADSEKLYGFVLPQQVRDDKVAA